MCPAALPASSGPHYVFNRADFPTGNVPSGTAVADFNGDGRQDLVVSNTSDNTVSILLGQADGTLGAKTDFSTGTAPLGVVVGDFNGDGKIDIAVVGDCNAAGCVSILLGNGDGTFQTHADYATGAGPIGLVVGDFNRDGVLDLAILDTCGPSCGFVSVLLGKGDGTFLARTDYPVGQAPGAIVVQDFNGDGNLDLAVANSSNTVSVLLGKGDGTFQAHVDFISNATPIGIAAGDFTGDKIPDLIITHSGAPWPVTLMKGNGDGTFQAEQQILQGPSTLDTPNVVGVDLNNDGKLDLVLSVVSQGAAVFLGNGDGTFQPEVDYAIGGYPVAFAVQDLNGDGNLDLAVVGQSSNTVTVLLGNGDGTFSPKTNLPAGPTSPVPLYASGGVIADFDGDGIPDLAINESNFDYPGSGVVSVLLGKGNGVLASALNTNSNGAAGEMATADFNGDGRLDIALSTGNGAAIMLGNGDGTFGAPVQVVTALGTPARAVVPGDFNNDGKQDLVVVGNGFVQSNPIFVLLGNGDGTFQPAKQFWSSTSIPIAGAAADFNHDGKLDLVITLNPNGIAVMLGNGDGTFQPPVIYATDELPGGLTVADLNGDGITDIVATGNQVDVFIGKGDGTFSNYVAYNAGSFPTLVITGDFNADGKVDIVAAAEGATSSGAIEVLLGNGDGTFQPSVEINAALGFNEQMAVGDLNQDGTTDLFTPGTTGSLFLSGPLASVTPSIVNLGTVFIGSTSAASSVNLTNSGNGPLDITGINASTLYSVTDTCGSTVAVSSSCAISVTFTPSGSGSSTGSLTITDNAPGGRQIAHLSGMGEVGFTLAVSSGSSNSVTINAGNPATYSLTATPAPGFSQAVAFSCTGAPANATCGVSPASVTLDGTNAATVSVQVSTTARSSAMNVFPNDLQGTNDRCLIPMAAIFLAPVAFLILVNSPRVNRQQVLRVIAFVFTLGTLLALPACGGSGSSGGGGGSQGTPSGTYTLNVTGSFGSGSGSAQQTIQLKLIVN